MNATAGDVENPTAYVPPAVIAGITLFAVPLLAESDRRVPIEQAGLNAVTAVGSLPMRALRLHSLCAVFASSPRLHGRREDAAATLGVCAMIILLVASLHHQGGTAVIPVNGVSWLIAYGASTLAKWLCRLLFLRAAGEGAMLKLGLAWIVAATGLAVPGVMSAIVLQQFGAADAISASGSTALMLLTYLAVEPVECLCVAASMSLRRYCQRPEPAKGETPPENRRPTAA